MNLEINKIINKNLSKIIKNYKDIYKLANMIFESSFNLNCKLGLKMFNFRLNNDEIEYNL